MFPLRTIFLVLTATALPSGLLSSDECSSNRENVLQPDYEYTYKYRSEAKSEAIGTTNDRGRMIIDCVMSLTHSHECYYQLKLKDCSLNADGGPPGSEVAWFENKPLEELSKYPLMFSLSDGEIKNVFKHDDDPLHSVNIKRGALSAFVFKFSSASSETKEMHTDIHGTCPYHSLPLGDVEGGVKVTKDMSRCAYPSRKDWQFSPWSIFWNMSFIQYQINSTMQCEYKVDSQEKRIEKVYCKERHAIGLESTHRTTTAVQTNVFYHVIHVKSEKLSSPSKQELPPTKSGIQYEYEQTPDPSQSSQPTNFMEVASEMLSELVEISLDEIRLFTIPKFTDFVAWLRTSYDLMPFVEKVRSCSFLTKNFECNENAKTLSMSYLSDALIQCNTAPCVKAFSELAINDDLSARYINFALYSWTNMHFTKPEIIEHIKGICMAKDTESCWIMLGAIVNNYHKTTYPISKQKSKEVDDVIDHIYKSIGILCGGHVNDLGKTEELTNRRLAFLKAAGNTGNAYLVYAPGGLRQVVKCITKDDTARSLKKAAFETLHMFGVCNDETLCNMLHKKLQPILLDVTGDIDLRIRAYNLLVQTPEIFSFEDDIMNLLKIDKNSQMLSYISSDLLKLMNDNEYRETHYRFIEKLNEKLHASDIVLESFLTLDQGKSYSNSYGRFLKFPFLPEEMQGFGAKLDWSAVYPVYNMIPQSFKTNVTVQLFNKVVNVLETGVSFEGLQSVGIMLKKIIGQMKASPLSHDKISNILRDIVLVLSQPDGSAITQDNPLFDENIVNGIRQIVEKYRQFKSNPKAFFNFYMNMLGRTLKFATSDDLKHFQSLMEEVQDFIGELHEGITYHNTKVIRVIEAYHQVPTMMGLPLNWTTNATLAFSLRGRLKLMTDQGQNGLSMLKADGVFHPSAALTFLNRMVLDFPTHTQIGVQANSSAYRSNQMGARLDYSDVDNTWKLSIDAPQKPQKILELFRTNQMIKHNSYEDIPDWDIERTSSSWCLNDELSSTFGVQLCREKSYPNVTHLIKPWALMAGWCKWRLELLPYDRDLKSYNFEVAQRTDDQQKTKNHLKVHFEAPGSSRKREINLNVVYDTSTGEADMNLDIPNIPQFSFVGKRKPLIENGVIYGLSSAYSLELSKELKYQVTYMREDKKEKMKDSSTNKNKSQKSKDVVTVVQERLLKLETPFNEYKWTRKMHLQTGNMKADVHLSYKNRIRDLNWLAHILPSIFWEDKNKAWVRFQISGKITSQKSKDTVTSHTSATVSTPHSSIDALYNALNMPGRVQVNFNLTRIEKPEGKLSTFVNFTHDLWISDAEKSNVKQIRSVSFTIPRKSWNLSSKRFLEDGNVKYDIVLTRAVMIPKDPNDQATASYVGWWSSDVESLFDLQKQEIKLKADLATKFPTSEDLTNEINNVNLMEIEGLRHKYIKANLGFHYPVNSVEQVVSFDGFFVLSGSTSAFRFQKDFVMSSSYNNMKLTSHSVYRTDGLIKKQLTQNSFFTHTTSDTKAFYNMEFKQSMNDKKCLEINFNHNITSHLYNMKSGVAYHCNSDNDKQHILHLNLDSSSDYWNMLNMQIRQVIEDISLDNSRETVTFVHPFMFINVTADWNGNSHRKTALFIRRPENVPIATLKVKTERPLENKLELDIHGDSPMKIAYDRKFFDNFKQVKARLLYPDQQHEVVSLHGKIINPQHRRWTLKFTPEMLKFIEYIGVTRERFILNLGRIAQDPNHPLNEMLKPALKMTIAQYISSLKGNFIHTFQASRMAVSESIMSLRPFYKADIEIVKNIAKVISLKTEGLLGEIKKKSITLWAINYFELPSLLQEGSKFVSYQYIPYGINMLKSILFPPSEKETNRVQTVVLNLGRILTWKSFNEMPFLDMQRMKNRLSWAQDTNTIIRPHHKKSFRSKMGMIFGPRHVYTFDGQVYEFPKYPSDECAYLLAHDVHRSLFSVFTTVNHIHILFPEMSISIGPGNEVYINGSKEEESSLPVQSKNEKVVVKREGNIVAVWSPVLTVLCEASSMLCTVELNGWSGGGTLGLLGNADGEQDNDFMLSDGRQASNVIEFAQNYELSGSSKCLQLQVPVKHTMNDEHRKRCDEILNKVVCPMDRTMEEDFLSACMSQLHANGNECSIQSALSALCYHHEGRSMETQCHVARQDSKRIRHKLEVVLLVNEQQSMTMGRKSKLLKGLESIVKAIDQQFQSNSYGNIVYSLIGFGGSGVHYSPTLHTSNSKIWVPMRQAVNVLLKSLDFKGSESFCPIEAINYAVEVIGHDTFDTKVFIIVTDSDTQEADSDAVRTVQQYLEKNHITLYAISNYSSIEKGKKVFGVRADGMLFPSSKDGESFLPYPQGDVAKLVSGTRGSLFLKKFVDSNGPATFFTEFATEIYAKVRREVELCRNCKTVASGWWYYFNQCHVTDCQT